MSRQTATALLLLLLKLNPALSLSASFSSSPNRLNGLVAQTHTNYNFKKCEMNYQPNAAWENALNQLEPDARISLQKEAHALNQRSNRPLLLAAAVTLACALNVRKARLASFVVVFSAFRIGIALAVRAPTTTSLVYWKTAYESGAATLSRTYSAVAHFIFSLGLNVASLGIICDLVVRRFNMWLTPTLNYIIADWQVSSSFTDGMLEMTEMTSKRKKFLLMNAGTTSRNVSGDTSNADLRNEAAPSSMTEWRTPATDREHAKLNFLKSTVSLSLLHTGLGIASALWAAEALIVVEIALLQRVFLLLSYIKRIAMKRWDSFKRQLPSLQRQAVETWDGLPRSFEEISQSFYYRANIVGLEIEQSVTRLWSTYLGWRQRAVRSSTGLRRKPSEPPSNGWISGWGFTIGNWWDNQVVRVNQAWVAWQIDSAKVQGNRAAVKNEINRRRSNNHRGAVEEEVNTAPARRSFLPLRQKKGDSSNHDGREVIDIRSGRHPVFRFWSTGKFGAS